MDVDVWFGNEGVGVIQGKRRINGVAVADSNEEEQNGKESPRGELVQAVKK